VPQQGSSPRRSARPPQPDHRGRHDRSPGQPRRADWQQFDPFGPGPDDELPPWAGPSDYPARPTSTLRRPAAGRGRISEADDYDDRADGNWQPEDNWQPGDNWQSAGDNWRSDAESADSPARTETPRRSGRRGRAAATRLRKSRRRVYRWCGFAIVVCVIAAGITALLTHHTPKPSLYVTALLPGEFKAVPNACDSVSGAVLNRYLPGPRTSANEISESTQSQCSFTLDRKPDFLVMEVAAQAYQPFAAATAAGSPAGSASANAQDNYELTYKNLAKPPRTATAKPLLSAARISPLAKTGQQAFVAVQTERASNILTDVVTVVIREHNVLVTVSESGQESGRGFGPVAVSTLEAGAEAAARDMLAKSVTEPQA
jgi:hypothetical protein